MAMKEHEEIFNNIVDGLVRLTQDGSIEWIRDRNKNDLKFEFIGDDNTQYCIRYKWSFGNSGWELDGGNLEIRGTEIISLWKWKWKRLEELQKILLSTYEFKPDESNVIQNLKNMSNNISKLEQRNIKISEIIDSPKLSI